MRWRDPMRGATRSRARRGLTRARLFARKQKTPLSQGFSLASSRCVEAM